MKMVPQYTMVFYNEDWEEIPFLERKAEGMMEVMQILQAWRSCQLHGPKHSHCASLYTCMVAVCAVDVVYTPVLVERSAA